MCLLPQGLREKLQERGTLGSSDWHGALSQRTRAPARRKGRSVSHFPEENGGTRRGTATVSLEDNGRDLEGEKRSLLYLIIIKNAWLYSQENESRSTVLGTPHTQSQPPASTFHLDTIYIQLAQPSPLLSVLSTSPAQVAPAVAAAPPQSQLLEPFIFPRQRPESLFFPLISSHQIQLVSILCPFSPFLLPCCNLSS